MREGILAALLAVAAIFLVIGATLISAAAGWIVAGAVLAVWAWLVLGEVE